MKEKSQNTPWKYLRNISINKGFPEYIVKLYEYLQSLWDDNGKDKVREISRNEEIFCKRLNDGLDKELKLFFNLNTQDNVNEEEEDLDF